MISLGKSVRFLRDVRAEIGRIAWPSMKETRMMTLMVFILVILIALYLMLIDFTIGSGIQWLLGA